jgi:glycosyltransferase involved in cell wall biosynthesis
MNAAHPPQLNVLYAGRLTKEKGAGLLVDAFEAALARDQRLHLVLAGGGPEEGSLRRRLGRHATFLGWLEGTALADAYAAADVFLFCSRTDTYGQVILEAQASGLPVVAVAEGGPASLIEDGRTGVLCPPIPRYSAPRWPAWPRRSARVRGCPPPRWPRSAPAPGNARSVSSRPVTAPP